MSQMDCCAMGRGWLLPPVWCSILIRQRSRPMEKYYAPPPSTWGSMRAPGCFRAGRTTAYWPLFRLVLPSRTPLPLWGRYWTSRGRSRNDRGIPASLLRISRCRFHLAGTISAVSPPLADALDQEVKHRYQYQCQRGGTDQSADHHDRQGLRDEHRSVV